MLKAPQLIFLEMLPSFFLRVRKYSDDLLFKAVRSAGRGRGLRITREKRLEKEKEEGRLKEVEKRVKKGRDGFSSEQQAVLT